ncbi:MAG TPA: GAF domain-containing sensor histidine kinase [Rhizobiaceae bacterium]|nr:GAF domain-containing sensor histidine kinase [Rhizobiaceae bacterium]
MAEIILGASDDFSEDIELIRNIPVVQKMLDVVLETTGMGFAAVARVTEGRWIACEVLDKIGFGLPAGGELKVETTLCHEVRQSVDTIAFNDALNDPVYVGHHTPQIYGLRSYISVPIVLADGSFFGTLCAIDPNPAEIANKKVIGTFELFADLIAHHIDGAKRLRKAEQELLAEQGERQLREHFVSVLSHDLRNPLTAVNAGANMLLRNGWKENSPKILSEMKASINRMRSLVDNTMEFARAQLGGGIVPTIVADSIVETLEQVAGEIRLGSARDIVLTAEIDTPIAADHDRVGQLLSNLLANAVAHGAPDMPVHVNASTDGGRFVLSVTNFGKRIPEEILPSLFSPYVRGRTEGAGLGLGLHIASKIAEAHNGSLSVTSDDERTIFAFSMPLDPTN